MTGWDILSETIKNLPPIAATFLLVAAAVIFIIGFSRRGLNFIKYGFGKIALDKTLENRFDRLEDRLDSVDARLDSVDARLDGMDVRLDGMDARLDGMGLRLDGMDVRIAAIETNHFGHLKNFLSELTSILLDKNIINNTEKTRLDNQLRDM